MYDSILYQSVPAIQSNAIATLLALAVFGFAVYKALVKKDEEFITKYLTGYPALAAIFILIGLSTIPAAMMAIFGPIEPLMTMLMPYIVAVFLGYGTAIVTYKAVDFLSHLFSLK